LTAGDQPHLAGGESGRDHGFSWWASEVCWFWPYTFW
jgi:hypothetical protein